MGENTKIEWTDHTFNPWVGCTKVSAACDHCYAEAWARRTGSPQLWEGERRRTTADYWRQPLMWQREAKRSGIRRKAFPSLCDPFDNQVPCPWRDDMWTRIHETPDLDWLLLTKRPQNVPKMLPDPRTGVPEWGDGWPNVWLGTTVENQAEADRRIPHLLSAPAAVRFLSCEPLLGAVDLHNVTTRCGSVHDVARGRIVHGNSPSAPPIGRIDWVICGGESGPGARPTHPDWIRSLRDQCTASGVPFFFKQWGSWKVTYDRDKDDPDWRRCPQRKQGHRYLNLAGGHGFHGDRVVFVKRVSKAKAGAELDGREWRQFPEQAPKVGRAA